MSDLAGIFVHPKNAFSNYAGVYLPDFHAISLRADLVAAAISQTREAAAKNSHAMELRGVIAHEITHGLDRVDRPGEWISAFSERLEMRSTGMKGGLAGSDFYPVGDIAKEAGENWVTNGVLSDYLKYPFEYNLSKEQTQGELLAQLGRLYLTNPDLMKKELPLSYNAMKEVFDAGGTVEESRNRLSKALRAPSSSVGVQEHIIRGGELGRVARQNQPSAQVEPASVGVEELQVKPAGVAREPDEEQIARESAAGAGEGKKPPVVPPTGDDKKPAATAMPLRTPVERLVGPRYGNDET